MPVGNTVTTSAPVMTNKLEDGAGQDKDDIADERAGQFDIRTALFLSALACFIAAIWSVSRPS
jgi:hypothetical protein